MYIQSIYIYIYYMPIYFCSTRCFKRTRVQKPPKPPGFIRKSITWFFVIFLFSISRLRGNLKGIQDSMEMQVRKRWQVFQVFSPNPMVNKNDLKIAYHFIWELLDIRLLSTCELPGGAWRCIYIYIDFHMSCGGSVRASRIIVVLFVNQVLPASCGKR